MKVKTRLECKINVTLLALLPNKIVQDSRGPATSSEKTGHARNKRAIPLLTIASNILILSNLQKPWTIACKDVSRVFEIEYSTYCILNRSELCECSLTAGKYLLSQTHTNCGDMPEARDGYFTTYYAFNKIILDVITVKFDIQVDDRTITQSTLLHDNIPGYNLLTLEFVLSPVNDNEDLILEEENPEMYVHLENVLVHMIDMQDIALFKSQKDYVRNKQKLSEYIRYAQIQQVLLVIFSYVAFTCELYL